MYTYVISPSRTSIQLFFNFREQKMWTMADSNKVVGQKMKVLSYQKHMNSLKKIKPGTKIETPWRPTFSLSKRNNKYSKYVSTKINKQNQNLLQRMLNIEGEPMKNTINIIPRTVPSNKQTFLELKNRQRKHEEFSIRKQNLKIVGKLEKAGSNYNIKSLNTEWRDNQKYRQILTKKESVPDYHQLARQFQKIERSRIVRPRTAFTQLNKNQSDFEQQ